MLEMLNKANQIHFYLNLFGLATDSWQMDLKHTKPILSTWLDTTGGKLKEKKKKLFFFKAFWAASPFQQPHPILYLFLTSQASNMYSVCICGEAVTQLGPDAVTKRHLVAGNTKADQNKHFLICVVSLWSSGRGEAAGSEWGGGGGCHVSPPPKSDGKSLIFPWHTQPPKTQPSESDGWRGEHAHHLT